MNRRRARSLIFPSDVSGVTMAGTMPKGVKAIMTPFSPVVLTGQVGCLPESTSWMPWAACIAMRIMHSRVWEALCGVSSTLLIPISGLSFCGGSFS